MQPPSQTTLEFLRQRIGLAVGDATRDPDLIATYHTVMQWMEVYLDRFLCGCTVDEEFTHVRAETVSLAGYPGTRILSMEDEDGNPVTKNYHVNPNAGLIQFDSRVRFHKLYVRYDFESPVIGPLWIALCILFDRVWSTFDAGAGAAPTGQTIKAISQDGARIEYQRDSSGSSDSSSSLQMGGMPDDIAAMLYPFRRRWC